MLPVSRSDRQHILIVLDDVLSDKSAVRSEMVERIFALGRHATLSVLIASQVANIVLTPVMKQNSDMILWRARTRPNWPIFGRPQTGSASKTLFAGLNFLGVSITISACLTTTPTRVLPRTI